MALDLIEFQVFLRIKPFSHKRQQLFI